MTHQTHHPQACQNKDLRLTRDQYLEMADGWSMPDELPPLTEHEGVRVVSEHLTPLGSKGRFGDLLVSRTKEKTLVYVAPRVGMAGISLAQLARRYGKRLVLFCPAAKEPSNHQLRALESGAELRFVRIAAMPVLQGIAKKWAEENGGAFLPLGLKHELVTAAIVKTCYELANQVAPPKELWCAISTGVLARGLAIGFPKAKIHVVAVSRNLKEGEAGTSHIWSSPYRFQDDCKSGPPFSSIMSYDAKAWEMMKQVSKPLPGLKTWFWNVAGEEPKSKIDPKTVRSSLAWGDDSDVLKR